MTGRMAREGACRDAGCCASGLTPDAVCPLHIHEPQTLRPMRAHQCMVFDPSSRWGLISTSSNRSWACGTGAHAVSSGAARRPDAMQTQGPPDGSPHTQDTPALRLRQRWCVNAHVFAPGGPPLLPQSWHLLYAGLDADCPVADGGRAPGGAVLVPLPPLAIEVYLCSKGPAPKREGRGKGGAT